jgi:ligand-binding sensor domain-containing protein
MVHDQPEHRGRVSKHDAVRRLERLSARQRLSGLDQSGADQPAPRWAPRSTSGAGFGRGAATNYGGTWHTIGTTLPDRFIDQLIIDPANPAHVYAVRGGYSRNWIPNAGVGHLFESQDGGVTFTDISGNLPDAPGNDLVITSTGKLVLATDVGVFVTSQASPGAWSRLGAGLPNAVVADLSMGSSGRYIIAATHGRGLWTLPTP